MKKEKKKPMPTTMLDPVRRSEEVFNVQKEVGWTMGMEQTG